MLEYLHNPIIFALTVGLGVMIYSFFEDSFTDEGIKPKTKYIRTFILTSIGIYMLMNYIDKLKNGGNTMTYMNQSYNVGHAPF